MSFAEKVKKLLKENDMTKADLAKDTGIPYTTLDSMLKRETDTARLAGVIRIARALGTSLDALVFEDEEAAGLTPEEERVLKLYALLDDRGKNTVLSLLQQEAVSSEEAVSLPLFEAPAAAGEALPILTEEMGRLPVGPDKVPGNATFAIRISGDSMEPLLSDGDLVFVEKTQTLSSGEVGIFLLNAESLCKKYWVQDGVTTLVSVNPKYPPIRILETDDLRLVGRVTGLDNEK